MSFSGSHEEQPEVGETEQLSPLLPSAPGWSLSSAQNKWGQPKLSLDSAEAARLKRPGSTQVFHRSGALHDASCALLLGTGSGVGSSRIRPQHGAFCTYTVESPCLRRTAGDGQRMQEKMYLYPPFQREQLSDFPKTTREMCVRAGTISVPVLPRPFSPFWRDSQL